ncbi:MAG: RHS repeat-associated core domain-containing protein [Clostridia bacterium]|nr:RHS repeat-associated core domain-containing protein [Clostridia bacterium]
MIGLEINGVPYYYVRNLQGDVTKIIDGSGNVVVEYTYDSWGKVYSVTGTLASTVGAKNPIRYRGYYYDTETELYYLNSRYYDPELGRFISPDVGTEGGNLYAYCQNDPVNRSDPSGCFSWGGFVDKIVDTAVRTWEKMVDVYCAAVETYCNVRVAVEKGIKKTVFYKIAEDIKNYDINNTDPDAVYNAHYFSGYAGQFVMLFKDGVGSASFGRIIVMDKAWRGEDEFKDVLRHEHGHYEQYKELGFIRYLFGIALPSLSHAIKRDSEYYNSQLHEVTADIMGGVPSSRTEYKSEGYNDKEWVHVPGSESAGWKYYDRIKNGCIFNIIIDCFLLYM